MKQITLLLVLSSAFSSYGQLTEGTWLTGGSGTFYSYDQTYTSPNINITAKYTSINISASVGYFVIDKLALGLSPSFSYYNGDVSNQGTVSSPTKFSIGPFIRYYFLDGEKPFNLLTDIRYQFGVTKLPNPPGDKGSLNSFSILAGPEIFFNSSVGLEILLGYSTSKETINSSLSGYTDIRKGFQTSLGFQIHLKKL